MRRGLACALLALAAGCGGETKNGTTKGEGGKPATTKRDSRAGAGFKPGEIYKTEAPGVVTLIALDGSGGDNLFGRSSQALGSGFVIDTEGHIATNAHVVTGDSGKKAQQVFIEFADGNKLRGRVMGTDPN